MHRRQFMSRAAAAGAGLLILPSARTAFGYRANERLNLGVVGMSGYGAYHGFASGIHLLDNVGYTHSCDVDLRKVKRVYDLLKQRAAEWPQSEKERERNAAADHYLLLAAKHPPLHADFRRMLDEADKEIDAVVVATPDHTHAVIAAAEIMLKATAMFAAAVANVKQANAWLATQKSRLLEGGAHIMRGHAAMINWGLAGGEARYPGAWPVDDDRRVAVGLLDQDAVAARVSAGQVAGARGAAKAGGHEGATKAASFGGEAIQAGRLQEGMAGAAQSVVAVVVGEDEDDVRAGGAGAEVPGGFVGSRDAGKRHVAVVPDCGGSDLHCACPRALFL